MRGKKGKTAKSSDQDLMPKLKKKSKVSNDDVDDNVSVASSSNESVEMGWLMATTPAEVNESSSASSEAAVAMTLSGGGEAEERSGEKETSFVKDAEADDPENMAVSEEQREVKTGDEQMKMVRNHFIHREMPNNV